MGRRKRAKRHFAWIRPGAFVHYTETAIAPVRNSPWLEGGRWFASLQGVAGFWPVDDFRCGECGGHGQLVRAIWRADGRGAVKVIRCPQCRGVGAKREPLDLREVLARGVSSAAGSE